MDRPLIYTGAIPQTTDLLSLARAAMEGQGWHGQGVLGSGPWLTDFTCIPQAAPNLSVQITPGQIFQTMALDATAYSDLAAVTSQTILKQGLYRSTGTIGCPAPTTSGFSINYLIEVAYSDVDSGAVVLPYYNASAPSVALSGPANSGTSQNTTRQGFCTVQAKAGIAATTGTQLTPSPDAGFVGAFVVTVAQGQTQILSGNIAAYAPTSFFMKLPALPAWVQGATWLFGADTGTANAITVALTPTPAAPPKVLLVKKIATANTGAMSVTITGLGTYSLINPDASAIASGEMPANYTALLGFDGTSYRFLNWTGTTAVGSLTASSGEGVNVSGGSSNVALSFTSLTIQNTIAATDLFAFYSQADAHHRATSWANLVSKMGTALGIGGTVPDGNGVFGAFGGVAPSNSLGLNGDYAFDVSTGDVFGPKALSAWPATPVYSPPTYVGVETSASYPIGSLLSAVSATYSGTVQPSTGTGLTDNLGFGAQTVTSVASFGGSAVSIGFASGLYCIASGPNAAVNVIVGQVWRAVAEFITGLQTTTTNNYGNGSSGTYQTATYGGLLRRIG